MPTDDSATTISQNLINYQNHQAKDESMLRRGGILERQIRVAYVKIVDGTTIQSLV